MAQKFSIFDAGSKRDSHDLVGLEIEQTEDGYELVVPRRVLAKSSLFSMDKKPLISFHFKDFHGFDWTLNVDSATPSRMSGSWHNNDPHDTDPAEESDSWTAAGTGTSTGDDEAHAASAK